MLLLNMLGGFLRHDRLLGSAHRTDLYSTPHFRGTLQCERERVDRSGGCFSLVCFTAPAGRAGLAALRAVGRLLPRQLRLLDRAGWLSGCSIGVSLPNTPADGAWVLVKKIMLSLPEETARLNCRVYCYPMSWPSDARGAANLAGAAASSAIPASAAGPIEAYFVQPLPAWKRALDILGASFGLLVLSPLLLGTAVVIKCTSPGPILFRQLRSGLGSQPFRMIKFRSMVIDAEARQKDLMALNEQDGPAFKIKSDPRVTSIGRFIRATSIDELPQLWNVLVGEMSLVGPRPLPCHESDACRGWQRQRLSATPGLTCIWQLTGRSMVTFAEWMRMDIRYIRSRTLGHDLSLLFRTAFTLLLRRTGC